jgi:plastocyanin
MGGRDEFGGILSRSAVLKAFGKGILRFSMPGFFIGLVFLLLFSSPWETSAPAGGRGGVKGTVRIGETPVERAVVYLLDAESKPIAAEPMERTIRQEGSAFKPDFLIVTVGSTLIFENQDKETHNVHSRSPGNRFDIGLQGPGDVKRVRLKKAGAVSIRCSIHTEMKGLVFAAPSPYFAVTDRSGRFEIDNLPAGAYRLEAWHPRLTSEEVQGSGVPLRVGSETVSRDLRIHAGAPAGADLTEVPERNWSQVVDEMRTSLDQAVGKWKAGKRTSAMRTAMTTYSFLYGDSGLRAAVQQRLGEARAEEHDRRINLFIKRLQNEDTGEAGESLLREDARAFIDFLEKDARLLNAP